MFLVQILLPLNRNDGSRQPHVLFEAARDELVEHFGGLTAYTRAPAVGLWAEGEPRTRPRTTVMPPAQQDEVVIVEVMAQQLDRAWWADFRSRLESGFRQQEIVVRAMPIEQL